MLSIESSAIESIADAIDLRQSVPMKRGSSAQCGGDLRRRILRYAASIAGHPDPTYKGLSRELLPNLHVNAIYGAGSVGLRENPIVLIDQMSNRSMRVVPTDPK